MELISVCLLQDGEHSNSTVLRDPPIQLPPDFTPLRKKNLNIIRFDDNLTHSLGITNVVPNINSHLQPTRLWVQQPHTSVTPKQPTKRNISDIKGTFLISLLL